MNNKDKTLLALGAFLPLALFDSLKRSKTLLIMLVIQVLLASGFLFFLYKAAGAS